MEGFLVVGATTTAEEEEEEGEVEGAATGEEVVVVAAVLDAPLYAMWTGWTRTISGARSELHPGIVRKMWCEDGTCTRYLDSPRRDILVTRTAKNSVTY